MSNVSYHFRRLAELGWIELSRTRPAGGSLEHIYRQADPGGLQPLGAIIAMLLSAAGSKPGEIVGEEISPDSALKTDSGPLNGPLRI